MDLLFDHNVSALDYDHFFVSVAYISVKLLEKGRPDIELDASRFEPFHQSVESA